MKLDIEKGEGIELRKRFGVQPIPALLFINADGEVEHKFIGAYNAEDFIQKASQVFTKEDRYGVLQRKFNAGQHELDFMSKYIYELIKQDEYAKAKQLVSNILDTTQTEHLCNKKFWPVLTDKFIVSEPGVYILLIKNRKLWCKNIGNDEYTQKMSALFINKANVWIYRGAKEYNEKIFIDLKKDIKKTALKNQDEVMLIVKLAEVRVKNDFDTFLSLLEKSLQKISEKNTFSILVNSSFIAKEGSIPQCKRFLAIIDTFINRSDNERFQKRLDYVKKGLNEKIN